MPRLFQTKWNEPRYAIVIAENQDALKDAIGRGDYFFEISDEAISKVERTIVRVDEITDKKIIAMLKKTFKKDAPGIVEKIEGKAPEESDTEKEEDQAEEEK